MRKILCAVVFGVLAACASNPDKMPASYVSELRFKDYTCEQIIIEREHLERQINKLYAHLKGESTADAWQMGVGLVLFWPSLFLLEGGDSPQAAEYTQLRGEYEALRKTSTRKGCALTWDNEDAQ